MSNNSQGTTEHNQQSATRSDHNEVRPSRRAVLSSIGALGIAGAVEKVAGRNIAMQQDQNESWPQYGPDNANTGYVPTHTDPGDSVVEQWHFPEVGSINGNGTVQANENIVIAGDAAGHTIGLDPKDGSERWRFNANRRVGMLPKLAGDTVYVGSRGEGIVYALDANSGTELWHREVGSEVSEPVVKGGTVFVSNFEGLHALNASNGNQRWTVDGQFLPWVPPSIANDTIYTTTTNEELVAIDTREANKRWSIETGQIAVSPVIADGTVYVGNRQGIVSAVNVSDGNERWSFETDGDVRVPPEVSDETVYIGGSQMMYAVDSSNGSEQWSFDPGGTIGSAPVVIDDLVYFGGPDQISVVEATNGNEQDSFKLDDLIRSAKIVNESVYLGTESSVIAISRSQGSNQWQYEMSGIMTSPAVVDGNVYVGNHDGRIYGINANDGSKRWGSSAEDGVRSSPAVANGTVYVGSDDENLFALDSETGSEEWTFQTDGIIKGSPKVVDGTVYFGSVDESVYALDTSSGIEEWRFEASHRVHTSPAVTDGSVYIQTHDHVVYALDVTDGSEQWQFDTGEGLGGDSSPAVADGTVFVLGNNGSTIHAIDAIEGRELWKRSDLEESAIPQNLSPGVGNGTVYLPYDFLDTSNGDERYSFTRGDYSYNIGVGQSPVMTNDSFYMGTFTMDLNQREEKWSFDIYGGIADLPAVVNGKFYFGSNDGRLYAFGDGVKASLSVPRIAITDQEVQFSASDSKTTADSIQTHEWSFSEDAPFSEGGESNTHTFEDPGSYTVRLRVTDSEGQSDTTSRTIRVFEEMPTVGLSQQSGEITPTGTADGGDVSVFERLSDEETLPLAIAGSGTLAGAGILAYRRLSTDGNIRGEEDG